MNGISDSNNYKILKTNYFGELYKVSKLFSAEFSLDKCIQLKTQCAENFLINFVKSPKSPKIYLSQFLEKNVYNLLPN